MKISLNKAKKTNAFTLIEMIGVLAVIAILAALLVPKIFNAINNARINSTALSIATIKTATADHYAKYGSFAISNGVSVPTIALTTPFANFDTALVTEQLLDKPFACAISTNVSVSVEPISTVTAGGTVTVNGTTSITNFAANDLAFDLSDTNATPGNSIAGTYVVVIFMANVLEADAQALNNIIDGPSLGVALGSATGDLYGRVKYSPVAVSGGPVDVTIYITHR
jgi:prepilin-type N-terminal cleavage/methylation domain-containing protein